MSLEDTARISCGCDGKRFSIFLDCPNPGSRVEKKKLSSTTGLRSTKTATRTNKRAVTAIIYQCAPKRSGVFETKVSSFIASAPDRHKIDAFRQRISTGHYCNAARNRRPYGSVAI